MSSGSGSVDGGDDTDWEGMKIGFCIVGAVLAFDAVLFLFIFDIIKARRLLTYGVRTPVTAIAYEYKGDREYTLRVSFRFKGPRTATYTQVMQTTVDDLKKKEARDHQVLVHPRDDSDNMLAAIADEIGFQMGMCAYFATLGFGFLIAGVIAAAHTPEHLDQDLKPDGAMIWAAVLAFSPCIVVYYLAIPYMLWLRDKSRRRVVSGVLNNAAAAETPPAGSDSVRTVSEPPAGAAPAAAGRPSGASVPGAINNNASDRSLTLASGSGADHV